MLTREQIEADARMQDPRALDLAFRVAMESEEEDQDLIANAVWFAVDQCGLDIDMETLEAAALAWLDDPRHSGER